MSWFSFNLTSTLLLSPPLPSHAQPFDSILKQTVDHVFVSVGFTYIDDSKWFTLTTLANQFVKDSILLVTIPQVNGTYPAVVKMRQPTTLNADKTVTFTIKIVQPNDSFCSKQWYVPKYIVPPLQVAWMVFELGAYVVNGFQFIAGKGTLTRASWSTTATFTNGNLIAVWFPTGCDTATDPCVLSATSRGGINLLQTDNNVKEVGKTLYLSVRARSIDQRRGQWVLVPHDVASTQTSYHILSAETLGYLVYQNGVKIECFEKMIWETIEQLNVNYIERTVTYQQTYDYPPGLFGIVGTITSLCDTILKSSNWKVNQGTFAINEDQCVKEEIRHTTPETVFLVVVGEKQATTSTYQCYVNFNSALSPTPFPTETPTTAVPTRIPTRLPTFSPTFPPSRSPSFLPSTSPSNQPTFSPTTTTASPTFRPSLFPSSQPTFTPSSAPTFTPSRVPTFTPSSSPTFTPSSAPSFTPSSSPTFTPSSAPTFTPSRAPTFTPSSAPTFAPSSSPTFTPSSSPTFTPSSSPSFTPSRAPTFTPSFQPSTSPSTSPSFNPTFSPTLTPSTTPSSSPSFRPSSMPSTSPSSRPTLLPSASPTFRPSTTPSSSPTFSPSTSPTLSPTASPTCRPTTPTVSPTFSPTFQPTKVCTTSFPVKIKKNLP